MHEYAQKSFSRSTALGRPAVRVERGWVSRGSAPQSARSRRRRRLTPASRPCSETTWRRASADKTVRQPFGIQGQAVTIPAPDGGARGDAQRAAGGGCGDALGEAAPSGRRPEGDRCARGEGERQGYGVGPDAAGGMATITAATGPA